ncbi:hypothetical protein EIP91_002196 [Steccherinum ochraceum]|uniref:Peptidase M20 dimerisation domain-containing protein n=1 Tax=Steccherinum ochraceum TaxID=92696 RepID=A0A4R0RGD8_9APHY|nr:hypothetical protein EIP91_002196 [Steccherinum ochraceum]
MASTADTVADIDDQPLSPSGTLVEKANHQAPPSYSHNGGPCSCSGSWSYPTKDSTSIKRPPRPSSLSSIDEVLSPEVRDTIHQTIEDLSPSLRELSDYIWNNPEDGFKEYKAHDALTTYMESKGFRVTRHYAKLDTAWRAEYTRGQGGRVIGVNSEMDALPGLGHACGHNLIAVSGIAVAVALKAAIDKHDVPATIILLGTPAEEFGNGKTRLLERGAYKDMDVCVMSHPGPGSPNGAYMAPWMALQNLEVEFIGHSAHAAYSPWEAQNALDAAFLAYSNVSVLRQQMKPTSRVHGIVTGKDWQPNVIPDYAKMRWIVRAPTFAEVEELRTRVTACFEAAELTSYFRAAALATGCKVKIELGEAYYDVRQSTVLSDEFCRIAETHLGMVTEEVQTSLPASSDFPFDLTMMSRPYRVLSHTVSPKRISSIPIDALTQDPIRSHLALQLKAIPSIQPVVGVRIQPNGGNHTPQFAETARTPEAHDSCMKVAKALAMTAFRVADDARFYLQVKQSFEDSKIEIDLPHAQKASTQPNTL